MGYMAHTDQNFFSRLLAPRQNPGNGRPRLGVRKDGVFMGRPYSNF
jgi:hypothetical protein